MRSGGLHDIKSSLPLQVALFFDWYYSIALFLATLLLLIYKAIMLPYPQAALGLEITFVFLYLIIDLIRLYLASRGNKTEAIGPLFSSLLLAVLVIIFHAYYLRLQTYVLRLDQVIQGIGLAFVVFEVLFSILALITFVHAQRF